MEKTGREPIRSRNLHEVMTALSKAGVGFIDHGVQMTGTGKPRR
jgi:hypothetical protein